MLLTINMGLWKSFKRSVMKLSVNKKLNKLEQQIKKLESKKNKLEISNLKSLHKLLEKTGVLSVSENVFIGGLLYIIDTVESNPKQTDEWRKAGELFRKRLPGRPKS
jgi:hypothetical protein